MGFIEKITEAMKPSTTQTNDTVEKETTETTNSSDEENTEIKTTVTNGEEADADPDEPKTYSQEEVDQLLTQNKEQWENDRLNGLSKESQIEELKAELLKRDLKEKVNKRLEDEKLPLGVANLVKYTDEAGTMESLNSVITMVNGLVSDAVTQRLRGKVPEGLGQAQHDSMSLRNDPFVKSFVDAMKN